MYVDKNALVFVDLVFVDLAFGCYRGNLMLAEARHPALSRMLGVG